jgi:hypothetical protein
MILLSWPVHAQLDSQGNTPELLARLMATDWVRSAPEWLRTAIYVWALSGLIRRDLQHPDENAPRVRPAGYGNPAEVTTPSP